MNKSCVLHEDAFYDYFKPIRHAGTLCDVWGGQGLETYGKDLEIVSSYDPDYVWTVVDGESDHQWIIPGFHFVNRVCYLVTEKPHCFVPVEFRVRKDALTPLGLKRQVSRVERLLAECSRTA